MDGWIVFLLVVIALVLILGQKQFARTVGFVFVGAFVLMILILVFSFLWLGIACAVVAGIFAFVGRRATKKLNEEGEEAFWTKEPQEEETQHNLVNEEMKRKG